MDERTLSFGYWLKRRRKALDLTQEALAGRACCSGYAIRKIEADERRPSRQLAERLADAVGVPDSERDDFVEAARSTGQSRPLRVDATPLSPASSSAHGAPHKPAQERPEPTAFVGRSEELALLDRVLRDLPSAGQLVLVEGEPGIGKSRLLREAERLARGHGLPVCKARCYEIERAIPYQSVMELVAHTVEHTPSAALEKLGKISLAELSALVPAISERFTDLPELARDFPEARQARLSHAVGQLLEVARGEHPLVLLVDDAQWADEASARVFHYLARQRTDWPLLALYAYRDEELGDNERLAQWVDSLCREAGSHRLQLARLSPDDTGELLSACGQAQLAAPELAARLHRESEGNPFFLTSILHSYTVDGVASADGADRATMLPDALRSAIAARLDRVPRDIHPILETAAVIGRRFDFDTLLAAGRETEGWLLDGLDALVKRQLLREEGDAGVYDFSHDKLREIAYSRIGGARRRMLHRAVAEALEGSDETESQELDARLAEHYERAQLWPKALHHLLATAERSQRLFAMGETLHWLDRAVALCESHPGALDTEQRIALFEQRGSARAQAGVTEGAVADIRLVIQAARECGDRAKARDMLIQLGMAHRRADSYQQASECLLSALAESRAMEDQHHIADTLYHLGTVAWSIGRNDEAIAYHQEAVDIAEREQITGLVGVQAYHGRGEAYFADSRPAAAIDCYTRSLELARAIGDVSYESENLMMIAHACTGSRGIADYSKARESFESALALARSADLQWHLGPTLLGLQHVQACVGGYGKAWAGLEDTMGWLQELSQVRYQLIGHDFACRMLLDLGLDLEAAEQAEQALGLADKTGIYFWHVASQANLAIARARQGRPGDAPPLGQAMEQSRRNCEGYVLTRCFEACAEIAHSEGQSQACHDAAEEWLALAQANGLPEQAANARRWRGEAWLLDGEHARADREFEAAASTARSIGRVRLEFDTEKSLAHSCQAQGRRDDATRHAARADEIAASMAASLQPTKLKACLPTFD